jgi:radical SAM superfamily enzyme YgiQ (UPF0313 family)
LRKNTNVSFIIPPIIPIGDLRKSVDPNLRWGDIVSMPMGPLSIASYTRKYAGVDFEILDLNVEIARHRNEFMYMKWDNFLQERLLKLDIEQYPDIVGISAIFNSNMGYLDLISAIAKKLWPEALVVAGGGLPTNLYSAVLDFAPAIDAVAIGEGEKPFCGLVLASNRMEYLETAPGWVTRKRVKAGLAPTVDLVSDLDEIPFLAYDLLEFEQYQKINRSHGEKQYNTISASIITSLGCLYRCTFCASHSVHGRKMRYHSLDRILADIRRLKQTYGVNLVLIEDDQFIHNKQNALRILEEISNLDIRIEFPNGLSIAHLDEDVINALKVARVKTVTLGVESGSERVLNEVIHKPYRKLSMVRKVVSMLRKKDIYTRAFFIIGFPGETKEEILESVRFMKDVGFNWVAIMLAAPIAGSELYEICKKNNMLISDKLENFYCGKCNIRLPHSTPEEIEKLRYLINLDVNFVENYDLKRGRPKIALIGFEDVINRIPDHAFAHYYASVCYKMMGRLDLERSFLKKYREIVDLSEYWAEYARYFNLQFKFCKLKSRTRQGERKNERKIVCRNEDK